MEDDRTEARWGARGGCQSVTHGTTTDYHLLGVSQSVTELPHNIISTMSSDSYTASTTTTSPTYTLLKVLFDVKVLKKKNL